MKLRLFISILIACCLSYNSFADVCTTTASGDWHDPSIWDCGHVPQCGDTIYIAGDDQVNVADDVQLDEGYGCNTPTYIVIQDGGTLWFEPSERMHLACGSGVTIEDGGLISGDAPVGSGGANSNYIDICDNTVWQAGDGPIGGPSGFGDGLPIELLFFNAIVIEDNEVMIVWQTASEQNNDYFDIERSTDGIHFESIMQVDGAGNSVNTLSYEAVDNSPEKGWSYYRLRQTDYDGKTEVFNAVPVHISAGFAVSIYPNPTADHFTLTLESSQVQEGEIIITDAGGRVVIDHNVSMREGFNQFEFDADRLSPGIYMISAIGSLSGRGKTHRLVVGR